MMATLKLLIHQLCRLFARRIPYAQFGLLLCSASIALASNAHADESGEYMLKAAFLYNFAIFTSWPERNMDNFNLCIYGIRSFQPGFRFIDAEKEYQ